MRRLCWSDGQRYQTRRFFHNFRRENRRTFVADAVRHYYAIAAGKKQRRPKRSTVRVFLLLRAGLPFRDVLFRGTRLREFQRWVELTSTSTRQRITFRRILLLKVKRSIAIVLHRDTLYGISAVAFEFREDLRLCFAVCCSTSRIRVRFSLYAKTKDVKRHRISVAVAKLRRYFVICGLNQQSRSMVTKIVGIFPFEAGDNGRVLVFHTTQPFGFI